jgi:predicted permease
LTAAIKTTSEAGSLRRRRWARALLVGGQVAVSVILLVVATFIYRGFQQQLAAGPGFRTDHRLIMTMAPKQLGYSDAQAQQFFEVLAERARGVPGVGSAALTRYMPMDGFGPPVSIVPEGFALPESVQSVSHQSSVVDEHYFETLGVPILKGRSFSASDSAAAPAVAIVNEVLAGRYWPGVDPIGKRFRLNDSSGPWVEIVGVARTTKYGFIIERPTPFVYFPYRQRSPDSMWLLVETAGNPTGVLSAMRDIVHRLEPNLPISNARTLDDLYRLRSVDTANVVVSLIASMGIMGLALAVVGLYGLVAYAASRRTREIGIRMAIGAGAWNVVRMVLSQGMVPALGGLGAGLIASAGAGHVLALIFFGGPGDEGQTDVVAFQLVAFAVLATTFLAAYIPARRASRINPTEALRCD